MDVQILTKPSKPHLEVTMHHRQAVQVLQAPGNVQGEAQHQRQRQPALAPGPRHGLGLLRCSPRPRAPCTTLRRQLVLVVVVAPALPPGPRLLLLLAAVHETRKRARHELRNHEHAWRAQAAAEAVYHVGMA